MEEFPNEKGVRAFSLFPSSSSYTAAHIKINGTTLAGVCCCIREETGVIMTERWGVPNIKMGKNEFAAKHWVVMGKAFSVDGFETLRPDARISKQDFAALPAMEKYLHASHLFANQVTTDGYDASILLFRSKNAEEQAEGARRQQAKEDRLNKVKRPKADAEGLAARSIPEGFRPHVLIGLDPGMRSLCTAVREDSRPGRIRRRSTRGQRQKRRNGRDIVEIRAREYRHEAGFRRRRAWETGKRRRFEGYGEAIGWMPSFKTSSCSLYLSRLKYFWRNLHFLLEFCRDHKFLKHKFTCTRQARVAVDALARRIVPEVDRNACVGYGNWSRTPGVKGHAPSPVKGLRQALAKRATVVSMDEFRTSKLCSTCRCELSSVSYLVDSSLTNRRKQSGRVVFRERDGTMETRKCHAVLKCENEGRPRPEPFCRPKKPKSASKTSDGIMGEIVGESSSESADET